MTVRDEAEIRNLLAEYCHLADSGDGSRYAALFTADGELVESGRAIGPPATIAALATRSVELMAEMPQPFGAKHLTVNSAVRVDGDTATARSALIVLLINPQRGWHISGVGQYDDDLVRTNDGWRFKRRTVSWFGDLGQDPLDSNLEFQQILRQMFADVVVGE